MISPENDMLNNRVFLTAVLVIYACGANAYCPPQYQNETVAPEFKLATEGLKASVSAVDVALSGAMELQSQRTTSALAVLTKQKALSANQIADSNRIAMQQLATGMGALSTNVRLKKAEFSYSPEFGQGFSPCRVYAQRQVISQREAEAKAAVRTRVMGEITAAPGRYVEPKTARKLLLEQNKNFCTQDHVDAGLCAKKGDLPGANLNVATLFEASMQDEPMYDAKVAFVNNLAPAPDAPLPASQAATPEAAAYSLAKARRDALVSPAFAALKSIQLDYSGTEGADTGKDLPLAVHYATEINRYNGNSEENNQWTQVLTAQNERGLLVELLKQKALDLVILEKQYRQFEQMESMLAALVSLEVQSNGLAESAAAAASSAVKQNEINKIQ